jgi:hypothetical protein
MSKSTEEIDVEILGFILQTVHKDLKAITDFVSRGIRGGFNHLCDQSKKIVEDTLKN